jgi:cohesin loading factor subunit SCC2
MIVLNTPFCKLFGKIMDVLLTAMMSDQATVRSKSLKSIVQLLEGDSSILERNDKIVRQIIHRTLDPSPLVRDSAVTLLGRCLSMKASIEHDVYEILLARAADTASGIRKKSMKLLKDIYLNNKKRDIRTSIADALLHRINDTDEGVSELARSMFEEIWMSPYYQDSDAGDEPLQYKLALKDQVSLIVKTVQRGESVAGVLKSLLKTLLLNGAKSSAANFRVCRSMVATMFDIIIDVDDSMDETEVLTRQHILQTLSIFAEAGPKLFSPDQLKQLQPYIDNLSSTDDISIYRAVLVIYRLVLPVSSNVQKSFLSEVQDSLLKSVQKLAKKEQDELVGCLWMIDRVLHNTDRLSRVALSCLKGVYGSTRTDFNDPHQKAALGRVVRYVNIAGLFGKHCDFDEIQIKIFRQGFPEWKGDSVSGLIVDLFSQFTNPKQPLLLRKAALDGICSICQAWPKQYMKATVCSSFEIVFSEQNRDLENLVLQGFKAFMAREEKQSEAGVNALDGAADDTEPARLSGAIATNENDGVSTSLAQRYLKPILRIALSAQDLYALTAVELVASINRQGLVHPKESGPVLVALETSLNTNIAAIAFREHRTLHQKHETIVEKEYMKAVQQAFIYQRDVVGDPLGAITKPYTSKLRPLFDVIKISKGKIRKKFLGNLCSRVDFDPAKLDASADVPPHVQFSRFVIENIAFFEYTTIDELLHILGTMERIVKSTGTSIAHSLETEIFKVQIAPIDTSMYLDPNSMESFQPQPSLIDEKRLRQLSASAMILTALWQARTFLRRSYGSTPGIKQRDSKAKISLKDLAKSPIRLAFVSGDKFWEDVTKTMAALVSQDSMLSLCQEFVELMSVDQDFKIAASASDDDDADAAAAEHVHSDSDEDDFTDIPSTPGSNGRGRKRKSSTSGGQGGGSGSGSRPKKKSKSNGRRSRGGSIHSNEELWE